MVWTDVPEGCGFLCIEYGCQIELKKFEIGFHCVRLQVMRLLLNKVVI